MLRADQLCLKYLSFQISNLEYFFRSPGQWNISQVLYFMCGRPLGHLFNFPTEIVQRHAEFLQDRHRNALSFPVAHSAHARFMREVITPNLREPALELVRRHQRLGDWVALVTATNDFITAPIAAALGIATLIAVRLERGAGGTITGRIAGVPSYRDGKVRRVEEWLAESGRGWADFERISVYSDSPNDLPLLERATEAVATNPSAALEAIAHQRGWRILKLFE